MTARQYAPYFYRIRALSLRDRLSTLCRERWVFERELRLGMHLAFDEDVACNLRRECRPTVELAKEIYRCERMADDPEYPESHRKQHEIDKRNYESFLERLRERTDPEPESGR